jgi:hypothetical protein
MVDEDTKVVTIKCIITMDLQCMLMHLINLVQDKIETEDFIEEETMTSLSNPEKKEEAQVDNTTITKVITDQITTITTNKITSTMIDNNIDTLVNSNSCTTMEDKDHQDKENTTKEKIEIMFEKVNMNSEVRMNKEWQVEDTYKMQVEDI